MEHIKADSVQLWGHFLELEWMLQLHLVDCIDAKFECTLELYLTTEILGAAHNGPHFDKRLKNPINLYQI